MTCEMPLTSMPRAATSVATSVSTRPASNEASAFSRWRWDLSPCMATASHAVRSRALRTSRSAPRLVRTNTSVRSRSSDCSSPTSALRRSSRSTARKRCSMSVDALLGRRVLVAHGVARVELGDPAGLAVERGGEEQRLALRRALGDDPVDGRAEAHVEHPVGLVEHERLHVVEREGAALEEVLEPAGRGDEDVRALRVARLLLEADAAVDGGDGEVARPRDRAQRVDDLAGELTRGGEHERRRAAGVGGDPVDDRHAEGERLAGPGGGLGEHVAAVEHVGDHELLDGEGGVDAALLAGRRQPHAIRRDRRRTAVT